MVNTKKYAVIVAGGRGTRMGGYIPKQFLPFLGKPLLIYAIEAFHLALPDAKIILVVPQDHLSSVQTIIRSFMAKFDLTITAGGETRFHSVQNGLKYVNNDGIVFVHDAARPMITHDLILRCYKSALANGNAIPAIAQAESVRMVGGNNVSTPVNRDLLRIIQTPQTFRTEQILPAFNRPYRADFTDEASVVEDFGIKVNLIEGTFDNIKLTNPIDFIIAEALLKVRHKDLPDVIS